MPRSRKLLALAALASLGLAGCVAYPAGPDYAYGPGYYAPGYYPGYAYGPGYYNGAVIYYDGGRRYYGPPGRGRGGPRDFHGGHAPSHDGSRGGSHWTPPHH